MPAGFFGKTVQRNTFLFPVKDRPGLSYSRRRDRINSVLLRSLDKGRGVTAHFLPSQNEWPLVHTLSRPMGSSCVFLLVLLCPVFDSYHRVCVRVCDGFGMHNHELLRGCLSVW